MSIRIEMRQDEGDIIAKCRMVEGRVFLLSFLARDYSVYSRLLRQMSGWFKLDYARQHQVPLKKIKMSVNIPRKEGK